MCNESLKVFTKNIYFFILTTVVFSSDRLLLTMGDILLILCIIVKQCAIKGLKYTPKKILIAVVVTYREHCYI